MSRSSNRKAPPRSKRAPGADRRVVCQLCTDRRNVRALVIRDRCKVTGSAQPIRGYDYPGTQETELHPPVQVTWTTFPPHSQS